jgi:hypothetical protein
MEVANEHGYQPPDSVLKGMGLKLPEYLNRLHKLSHKAGVIYDPERYQLNGSESPSVTLRLVGVPLTAEELQVVLWVAVYGLGKGAGNKRQATRDLGISMSKLNGVLADLRENIKLREALVA